MLPTCTVSGCDVIRLLSPWSPADYDVAFRWQSLKGLCDPVVKRSCCGLVRSTPAICPTHDGGSSVRPSDKVEETCWLFSSNKELLIVAAAAAAFQCKSLFLPHIFFLSMNLPKSACPSLLCEHVKVCDRYQPLTATSCQRTRQGQKAAVQPDGEM